MFKKNLILIFLISACSLNGFSQIATIQGKQKVAVPANAFYPVLSKSGDKLLYTSPDFKGLKMMDLKTKKTTIISSHEGAGFDPSFIENGNKVAFRESNFVNGRKYQSVKVYDAITTGQKEVVASTRNLKTTVQPSMIGRTSAVRSSSANDIMVYSDAQSIIINQNGKESKLYPLKNQNVNSYIWASLSPDKNKILFYAVTKGVYVSDLKGNILAHLGEMQAPVWYGDNYVVAMDSKSDENTYVASRILIADSNGKGKQFLTGVDEIAMYPSASAEANKIAYNTLNGDMYLLTIKLEK